MAAEQGSPAPDPVSIPSRVWASLDWEDIRYFVALAEHGSLSATARAFHVNHATVARRVVSLEKALGHTLFDRHADGNALTLTGRAVLVWRCSISWTPGRN